MSGNGDDAAAAEQEGPSSEAFCAARDQAVQPARPPIYRQPKVMLIGAGILLILLSVAFFWWWHSRFYVSTDDAFIDGPIVQIAPQISGRVMDVPVKDNQDVKAGQVLVEIDPTDYGLAVEHARANLAQAQGQVAQAKAQVTAAEATSTNATAELHRLEAAGAGAVSAQQLDTARAAARNAEAQLNVAQSAVTTAQANVASAQAQLQQAQTNFSYTKITAPEAGRITGKHVWPGSYVQSGQIMMTLVPKNVWVTANFKETDLELMQPGQPAWISVDAYGGRSFQGHVESIQRGSGAAFSLLPPENATGNYVKVVQRVPVRIVFNDRPQDQVLLGPGMSVVATVQVRRNR